MPTIDSPYGEIYYEQSGDGPDLVWLSAGDMPGSVWRNFQTPAFDDSFRSTTYDARGIGKTIDKDPSKFSIERHAEDCVALLREVCDGPAVLIGLSMGSLIAQEISFTHPELVDRAILMGSVAKKTGFIQYWEDAEIAFRRGTQEWSRELAVAHYALLMYPAEVLGDDTMWEKIKPLVEQDYGERDDNDLANQWQACLDYDSVDRLPHCEVPLHVISFEQDVQTPPQRNRQVADLAKHGHFYLLEGLGHGSAYGHAPDTVNQQIKEILRA